MNIKQSGAVSTIHVEGLKVGWEQWVLLMSDIHHDSVQCNRDLETQHLELAKKRKAWVFIGGDLFDAMQGRFDPRRSMNELRPEYRRDDYYDYVVKDLTDYLKPYSKNIMMIADGNHELAVLKNANTNLADRLVSNLRAGGSPCVHGGYGGWVVFSFSVTANGPRFSIRMKYFHGAGGEAPVTRGMIQTARQAVYLPDADIVWNGHNHNEYITTIVRERISDGGKIYFDQARYLRTPGYKQGYADGSGGWEVTRGGVPKPIGAIWVRLAFDTSRRAGTHASCMKIETISDVSAPDVCSPTGEIYEGRVFDEV